MLRQEDFVTIQALARRGVYKVDIARELGVHPKTVSRALKRGSAPKGQRKPRESQLTPYLPIIDRLLSEDVWNGVVILREIQAKGYKGGMTVLGDYIRPKRAVRAGRPTVRFETEPGKQLQTDWGQLETTIAGVATKVHFCVNTLGFSRRFHFWCTDSEDAEHTFEGLIRSWEYFGGVTDDVLLDNQKAAVLEHRPGGKVKFNPRFVDLMAHYGVTPKACRPARARTKGKDERMVGYIKHHFFVRYRSFDSFAHLNQLAEQWLAEETDRRLHGTVKEIVAERFEREKPALSPLPATRYDTAYRETRQAGWDAFVDVRGNRYAVPGEFAGRTVAVRITLDDDLFVYHGDELIARHRITPTSAGWVTVPELHASLWEALKVEQRPLMIYEEVS